MPDDGAETTQRIPPLPREQWGEAERDVCGFMPGRKHWEISARSGLMQVLVHHPDLAIAYLNFGRQVLQRSRLPDRPRELLTLRIAAICDTAFEWVNHVDMARAVGISDEEIEACRTGSDWSGWAPLDRAVIAAVEQMFAHHRIDDATWAALAAEYDTRQMMDLVFTAGHYAMTSWAINTFGIGADPDREEMMAQYLARRERAKASG